MYHIPLLCTKIECMIRLNIQQFWQRSDELPQRFIHCDVIWLRRSCPIAQPYYLYLSWFTNNEILWSSSPSCVVVSKFTYLRSHPHLPQNELGHVRTVKYDDVIKGKHFPRYWSFVRGIHRSTVNSPHKCQWRGAMMFSLICVWINGWVNNRKADDLRRYCVHCDVTVMKLSSYNLLKTIEYSYLSNAKSQINSASYVKSFVVYATVLKTSRK